MGTNTGIGIGIGIPFKNFSSGGRQPLPPDLKASLKGVWIAYGKSNNDADRSIVKNLVDLDNPFIISNAAFKLNSGFGKYEVNFTSWIQTNGVIASSDKVQNSIIGRFLYFNTVNKKEDVPSFKVNITLGQQGKLQYNYIKEDGTSTYIVYSESGIYTIPASYFSKYTGGNAWFGFYQIEGTSIIEQIPSLEGAFVTDGIDDLITSTKTVQEMLGGSNEITVVSMIHQIGLISSQSYARNNYFIQGNDFLTNTISAIGKIGIYGYKGNLSNIAIVNDILGDKKDYSVDKANPANIDSVFSVNGTHSSAQLSSVAWYWTFIANKVLTTDQINQVIAYFNLDRTLKPDILCNITKQGITNDNHADFNDKLVDYSGNGRDIQMNNLAWKGGSGIAAKQYETFKDWLNESSSTSIIKQIDEFTRIVESTTNGYWVSRIRRDSDLDKVYDPINVYLYQDNNFLIHECKYEVDGVKYSIPIYESVGKGYHKLEIYTKDRYTELPENAEKVVLSEWYFPKSNKGSIKYSLIPSYKGGILLDGVNDFGKVTGMPVYKDYTIVVDYERISGIEQAWAEALISKSYIANQGAFVLMETNGTAKHSYSFGAYTTFNKDDSTRTLLYQSKYKCGDVDLNAGTGIDRDTLWLGTYRDNYSSFFNGAIYSLMSFPYSMSEFLIERQLKKHKLGTLYPDMVEFRPIVTYDKDLISKLKYFYIRKYANWVSISPGDYLPNNAEISFTVDLRYPVDEVSSNLVFSNLENVRVVKSSGSDNSYDIRAYVTNKSPQKINITIDEYIRFEDIVQPYPSLFTLIDYDTEEVYSWGSKLKVGARFKGNVVNLLPNMYEWQGNVLYNGEVLSWGIKPGVVAKEMVFSWNMPFKYLIDNNEPKCILSPRLLRIPNSSYKILGYIPDISGHGNHGKINNSAYAGMSGANGYLVDFNSWVKTENVTLTDNKITVIKDKITYPWISYATKGSTVPTFKVNISGIPNGGRLDLYDNNGTIQTLTNGVNDIEGFTVNDVTGFLIYSGVELNWSNLVIQQIGEYEGAYCLDGVDDHITIPTLSSGGKQVLMKVNWNTIDSIIYDQRGNGGFAIYCSDYNTIGDSITVPAYRGRNAAGTTYIDGIRNEYIIASQLRNVTHNIVEILDTSYAAGNINPIIGKSYMNNNYGSLALYDFMLFDDISTDDKIKQLNEYVGIEAKVELPPYYWDAYGKTNLDADKATIQQRGVAVGDYDLTNTNFAYDKMSGFGGYEFEKFTDTTKWIETKREDGIEVIEKNDYSFTAKKVGTGQYFWDFKNNSIKTLDRDLTVKAISNNNVYIRWEFKYRTAEKPDIDSAIILLRQAMTPNVPITVTLPYKTQEEQTELGVVEGSTYYLFYFDPSDIPVGDEYTVEMLPLYPNGLVYDGVSDFTNNKNIPILTDFTFIIKREILGLETNESMLVIKGGSVYNNGIGNAFILEHNNNGVNYVYSYGKLNQIKRDDSKIIYLTPESYNGNPIIKGENGDNLGLVLSRHWRGIIYKTILYSKTISLLQINFLKNLMEKDEIIDLNNPIFIKNE